jgi:hypothetical protein
MLTQIAHVAVILTAFVGGWMLIAILAGPLIEAVSRPDVPNDEVPIAGNKKKKG